MGRRQLRNDNHTRLSQTPRDRPKPHTIVPNPTPQSQTPHTPARTPPSAILIHFRKGFWEPFSGASPQGNETAENNCYFSFFCVCKG